MTSDVARRTAVLFIGFGGPEKREDVRPFLEIVTRGRRIPPARLDDVEHHYEVIGGASPINAITNRQAEALRQELIHVPVYVGHRNWHPFIEETLKTMAADGIEHAIGFPTAAHRTEASWERYLQAVELARQKVPHAPQIHYVAPWHNHPHFISAICERIKEAKPTSEASWVFTAHSIPVSMAQASRYVEELQETASLVAGQMDISSWTLAYTSRSGAPTDPWLEPDVCDVIREHSASTAKCVFVIPIGFIADHVEVLFDLDVEAKAAAEEAGVGFQRAKTVGDHPLFVRMMADVVRRAMPAVLSK